MDCCGGLYHSRGVGGGVYLNDEDLSIYRQKLLEKILIEKAKF